MARCWYYDVSELADPDRFARGMESLPWEERRQAIMRYRMQPDRLLGLGAGLLCVHALQEAGVDDLTLAYGTRDKPYLKHRPHVHFNLSHSGTMALCAVSSDSVGADVERLHPANAGIARRCFVEQEISWMNSQDDPDHAFTRLWTRKESYIKRLGTGFYTDPKSFCALPYDGSTPEVAYSEHEAEGHLMCVCTRAGQHVEFTRWQGMA